MPGQSNESRARKLAKKLGVSLNINHGGDGLELEAWTPKGMCFDPGSHLRLRNDGHYGYDENATLARKWADILAALKRVGPCDCERCTK